MKTSRIAPALLLAATLAACKQAPPPAPAPYPVPVSLTPATPEPPASTFTVTGTATLEVAPDTAELRVTLSSEASRPGAATRAARAKQAKLIEALARHGITENDLRLSHLSINPTYNYQTGKITGYAASIQVTASTKEFDKIGTMMEAAADAGATHMDSYFRADLAALKKKVREMALDAAKEKAEQIGESLDLALGKVTGVQEGANDTWSYYGEGYYYSRAAPNAWGAMDAATASMPTINPELQPLTLSISLTYKIG